MQIIKDEYRLYDLNVESENIILLLTQIIATNFDLKLAEIELEPCGDKRFNYKIIKKYYGFNLEESDLEELIELYVEKIYID